MDIEKLAVECGFNPHPIFGGLIVKHSNGSWIDIEPQLQAFAESYAEQENYILLGVIADIRIALGVNEKPMLSELANVAKEVKAENEALKMQVTEQRAALKHCAKHSTLAVQSVIRRALNIKVSE